MAIEDKVKRTIQEVGEIEGEIEGHFSLDDYGYDSMDLVDLIARLEDLVDENLDDEALFQLPLKEITVAEIISLVKKNC